MNLNTFAKEIYEQNKAVGWWDDPDRCIYTTLQLISTELAEATEGERKNLMDDHLHDRKMGEVELADALIRVLDLGGRFDWKYNKNAPYHFMLDIGDIKTAAAMHLVCNLALSILVISFRYGGGSNGEYSGLINTIIKTSEYLEYDIETVMVEKLTYNKTRADHQRKNRAKAHGKKF